MSRRVQATVLTAALVLGSAAPTGIAVAQEADQGSEGTAAPEQAPPDRTADPDFDPGADTALPFDVGGHDSDTDDSGHGAPVDSEPVEDLDAPPAPTGDPSAMVPDTVGDNDEVAAPSEPAPPAEPVATPPPAPTPVPPATTTPAPTTTAPTPDREQRTAPRKHPEHRADRRKAAPVSAPAPAPVTAPTPAPQAPPVETAAPADPVAEPAPIAPSDRARPGQRSHTVQPGESLWLIASDLLGRSTTDAQIAAETNRLYRLNRDRIGNDPNLLLAGTVLGLR